MKMVCVPLCVASLAVHMTFLGFHAMDQVHASGTLTDGCIKANFIMAENDCKIRNKSLFTLSDLKTGTGGRFALNATSILTEIWIKRNQNGSCQTYRRLPTGETATEAGVDPTFRTTSCEGHHHFICKQNAYGEPQYYFACYEKTSTDSRSGNTFVPGLHPVYPVVIATVFLVTALGIGISAVYVIIKKKTNVRARETTSQAGDRQHTGSNLEGADGCGLQTEGTEAANHDRPTIVEVHGPVDADQETAVVVVQCRDPSDADSLEASPSDVTN